MIEQNQYKYDRTDAMTQSVPMARPYGCNDTISANGTEHRKKLTADVKLLLPESRLDLLPKPWIGNGLARIANVHPGDGVATSHLTQDADVGLVQEPDLGVSLHVGLLLLRLRL